MLSTRHYVPILRWKQAEKFALHRLSVNAKRNMTPTIEITPASFLLRARAKTGKENPESDQLFVANAAPDPGSVLRHHAKEVLRFWGNSEFFLELGHLEGTVPLINGKTHALTFFGDLARSFRLKMIPVTGLSRPDEYQSAVADSFKRDGNGLCLRVTVSELNDGRFASDVAHCVRLLGASLSTSDLLIDYGVFDPDAPGIKELLAKVPDVRNWRSLIVACGAFPKDLQGFKPGTHKIARSDWTAWVNGLRDCNGLRWPAFSDYTIQYGKYVEPVDNANPSASIRYTLADEWLIMRGEGIFNEDGPGRAQWNAHAVLLAERDEFYGADFCDGDAYIATMSHEQKKHGSPMTWIRAGLNHHMSVVLKEIAEL